MRVQTCWVSALGAEATLYLRGREYADLRKLRRKKIDSAEEGAEGVFPQDLPMVGVVNNWVD